MKLLLPVLTASLLAACSTYDGSTRFDLAGKMAPLVKNKSDILITEVPDAGNALSNGMLLMMQGGGGTASNAAIGITNILGKPGLELGISGRSESVTVATLKRALQDFQGQSDATLYLFASPQNAAELNAIAAPKGITIHALER